VFPGTPRTVTVGDKVYSRTVKVKGANAFEPPFNPASPRL
jgi:hypothetical protein